MAGYGKKIVYLSCMDKGEKVKNGGFLRVATEKGKCSLDMHVSGMEMLPDGKYDICAVGFDGREGIIGRVPIYMGQGAWKKEYDGRLGTWEESRRVGDEDMEYEDVQSFLIKVSDDIWLEGKSGNEKSRNEKNRNEKSGNEKNRNENRAEDAQQTVVKEDRQEQGKWKYTELKAGWINELGIQEPEVEKEEESGSDMDTIILNDKWEQLQQIYPVIHPYEDDRRYISIQPKDFVIMTGDYQHLANNSFLLHGYYNYRHIILGHETEGESFYLGVPGVYYEREKMVALMFGFEAFECNGGKAESGKFGYYLRKVKI